jgi:CheY-like chemotaxis protein
MNQNGGTAMEVLLVEDNPADVRLMEEAFRERRREISLRVVPDGVEAMAYLRHEGVYANAPHPDIVLLDLNLPRKNGHEVLAEIKCDPALKLTPVVVLTTSSADEDIHKAYGMHANCYVTKPVELERFLQVVESIDDFWLNTARLPGSQAGKAA